MGHRWELLSGMDNGLIATFGEIGQQWATRQSDVHQCRRCGQICLSEIGGRPDEAMMAKSGFLIECEEQVVRSVHDS